MEALNGAFEKTRRVVLLFGRQGLSIACVLLTCLLLLGNTAFSQSVPDTNDTTRRSSAAPQPGWSNVNGSCDCSDSTRWGWGSNTWENGDTHAPPILGHTFFMSCGSWFSGESATGVITGLTKGITYKFSFYVAGFKTSHATYGVAQGNSYKITVGNEDTAVAYNSNTWIKQEFIFTADSSVEPIIVQGPQDSTSPHRMTHFSFGSDAVGLPVQWLDFKLMKQKDAIKLLWLTAGEKNNARFDVERMYNGDIDFLKIGEVEATLSPGLINRYSYYDPFLDVRKTKAYYRLKQIDRNGTSEYSEVKSIFIWDNTDSHISVVPNPVSDELTISSMGKGKFQGFRYQMVNAAGQLVVLGRSSTAELNLNTKNLKSGVYVLRIIELNGTIHNKRITVL